MEKEKAPDEAQRIWVDKDIKAVAFHRSSEGAKRKDCEGAKQNQA